MAKKLLLFLILISVLIYSGCGGGGGGGGDSYPTTGNINGTITTINGFSVSSSTIMELKDAPKIGPIKLSSFINKTNLNEKIVKFQPNLSQVEIERVIALMGAKIKKRIYGLDNTYVITINPETFKTASTNQYPELISITNNNIYYATEIPNDTDYNTQKWHYEMMNLPDAWSQQKGNSYIVVAVLDTGISLNHPDLAANLVPGYDFVDDDSNPSDNVYSNEIHRYSHGTHVAGTISAVTNNAYGVTGVGWNVKVMPIRVLNPIGSGTSADIISGIEWAVDHGAKVINLSLGGPDNDLLLQEAIADAVTNGVTVIAAAGNHESGGISSVNYPAKYPETIAVSALGHNGEITAYSNIGPEIDVCAPGGDDSYYVYSTSFDKKTKQNCYVGMSGTSMSTPHIAGLAALLYSRGMTDPATIRQRIQEYVYDKDPVGKDVKYGYGLPNAANVINGAPFGMPAVKVFYTLSDGTAGTFRDVDGQGKYLISKIPPNTYHVCAFLDKNSDGRVDAEDKFGFIPNVSVVVGNTVTADFNLDDPEPSGVGLTLNEYLQKVIFK